MSFPIRESMFLSREYINIHPCTCMICSHQDNCITGFVTCDALVFCIMDTIYRWVGARKTLAIGLRLSCTNPSIWSTLSFKNQWVKHTCLTHCACIPIHTGAVVSIDRVRAGARILTGVTGTFISICVNTWNNVSVYARPQPWFNQKRTGGLMMIVSTTFGLNQVKS